MTNPDLTEALRLAQELIDNRKYDPYFPPGHGDVVKVARALLALEARVRELEATLESTQLWFRARPWEGNPDSSSFGCGDYTPQERALGYGTYRDPRFLPDFLREVSSPASE